MNKQRWYVVSGGGVLMICPNKEDAERARRTKPDGVCVVDVCDV